MVFFFDKKSYLDEVTKKNSSRIFFLATRFLRKKIWCHGKIFLRQEKNCFAFISRKKNLGFRKHL